MFQAFQNVQEDEKILSGARVLKIDIMGHFASILGILGKVLSIFYARGKTWSHTSPKANSKHLNIILERIL